MSPSHSAPYREFPARADFPGSVVAGAFHIARTTGGRTAGMGVAAFALTAAHVALFALLIGENFLRRTFD